eukprot:2667057-Lingulodinium_polyedra.AAC.1
MLDCQSFVAHRTQGLLKVKGCLEYVPGFLAQLQRDRRFEEDGQLRARGMCHSFVEGLLD